MSFLTREQILAAQDRRFADVDVPEWGGKVRISSLTATQAQLFHALNVRRQAGENVDALGFMVAASVVDADGNALFSSEKDLPALGKKGPEAIARIATEAMKLNTPDQKPRVYVVTGGPLDGRKVQLPMHLEAAAELGKPFLFGGELQEDGAGNAEASSATLP